MVHAASCLLTLNLLVSMLHTGPMPLHPPSSDGDIESANRCFSPSPVSKSSNVPLTAEETFAGDAHISDVEQIEQQEVSIPLFFGVDNGNAADLLQTFSWDALEQPPGSTSELTTFEDELEEDDQNSVTLGRKRRHHEIEDDKESSSSKSFECRFCTMKFQKSQALGGHMNRHKQERQHESWNKAFQLVQQGNPSTTLPGLEQVFSPQGFPVAGIPIPSEVGCLGVESQYGGVRRHLIEKNHLPYCRKEYVNVKPQILNDAVLYKHGNCLTASSEPVPVIETLQRSSNDWSAPTPRSSMHSLTNQAPCLNRSPSSVRTTYPNQNATAVPTCMEMNPLHKDRTGSIPHGNLGRCLDQSIQWSQRETSPQSSLKRYRNIASLPQGPLPQQMLQPSRAMQPGIVLGEPSCMGPTNSHPVKGPRELRFMQPGNMHGEAIQRDLPYWYLMEATREPTSLGIRQAGAVFRNPRYMCPNNATSEPWFVAMEHDMDLGDLNIADGTQGGFSRSQDSASFHSSTRAFAYDSEPRNGRPSLPVGNNNATSFSGTTNKGQSATNFS